MTANQNALATSALVAVGAYLLATATEFTLISVFRPSEQELTWISNIVLAATVGTVTYLWQHLRVTRASLSAIERDSLILDTQLSLAADVQRSLLPELPTEATGAEWAARLEPAGKVGGDFYDLITLADGTVMFILGDISGKGIPAAMLLAYSRAVFRTIANERPQPAALVHRLSQALHRDTGGSPYVTCIVGRLDAGARTLIYVNAGHPPGLLFRRGGGQASPTGSPAAPGNLVLLEGGGPPAGLLADIVFDQTTIDMQPDDLVVLFTDGVTEAVGTAASSSTDQLVASVRQLGAKATPARTVDALIGLARAGGGPEGVVDWQDDRTVLAFRVRH